MFRWTPSPSIIDTMRYERHEVCIVTCRLLLLCFRTRTRRLIAVWTWSNSFDNKCFPGFLCLRGIHVRNAGLLKCTADALVQCRIGERLSRTRWKSCVCLAPTPHDKGFPRQQLQLANEVEMPLEKSNLCYKELASHKLRLTFPSCRLESCLFYHLVGTKLP